MKFIGMIIVATMLFVSNVSAATNVTASWLSHDLVQVTWTKSNLATRACVYRKGTLDSTPIFLDCTTTGRYTKPADGDTRYTSREGDVYCIEEYDSNNNHVGEFSCSNPLGKRPPRYRIILPIVIR